jgi:ribosomal protein S2
VEERRFKLGIESKGKMAVQNENNLSSKKVDDFKSKVVKATKPGADMKGKGKVSKGVDSKVVGEERLRRSLESVYGLKDQQLSLRTPVSGNGLMEAGLASGIHWGRAAGQIHSDMRPFVLCRRSGSFIFDLRWTFRLFGTALSFLRGLGSEVKARKIIFVGEENLDSDNPHYFASRILRATAKRCGETAMGVREASLFFNQEVYALRPKFSTSPVPSARGKRGAKNNKRSPAVNLQRGGDRVAALVLIGGHSEGFGELLTAATRCGCPVVSLVDTASSLKDISYPIPGNTRSVNSVYFFMDLISNALYKGNIGKTVGSAISKQKVAGEAISKQKKVVKAGVALSFSNPCLKLLDLLKAASSLGVRNAVVSKSMSASQRSKSMSASQR